MEIKFVVETTVRFYKRFSRYACYMSTGKKAESLLNELVDSVK